MIRLNRHEGIWPVGWSYRRTVAVLAAMTMLVTSCSGSEEADDGRAKATGEFATDLALTVDESQPTAPADFDLQPGTEEVTLTGAEARQRLSLVDADGNRLVVLKADDLGQAHFSYLPGELAEYQTGGRATLPTNEGYILAPGKGYTIRNEDTEPVQVSEPFEVWGRDDNPDPGWYDDQVGDIGPSGEDTDWFGYVTMRDGVQLSVNVRLPGPVEDGPYPTVVEYSGYGPSNPGATEPGSMIAGLLGYATIGVNMRGSGCSGGVFDVFNTAQQVDGYDVVEAIARQPWVKHSHVGMVGLSYAGITQLYTAATQPPSLAAVTALSVIKDPWLQQWPGGVYNGGFTRKWLSERDNQASAGGMSWTDERIEAGDEVCESHMDLREQNIDFEAFGRSLVHKPESSKGRDLSLLVPDIDVPVYLTGAWQDEQTGPQFGDMLGDFTNAPVTRFTLFNGRHPDGYTPQFLTGWYEFLELYVNRTVPMIDPGLRDAGSIFFEDFFGVPDLTFAPDTFPDAGPDDYDEVRAAYEAMDPVRVVFESGAGGDVPGSPVGTFEATYASWPPEGAAERAFYLGAAGSLLDAAPSGAGVDRFTNDPASAPRTFFASEDDYELLAPTWNFAWEPFAAEHAVSYLSEPFTSPTVLGGIGHAELHLQVPDGDADVQVTLSLVAADDTEWLITSGLLRLSDRAVDDTRSTGLRIERTFAIEDSEPMPEDGLVPAKVAIPSFAQAFRSGDRLRVTISSPGRDFGAWSFETIGEDGAARDVGWGDARPSRLMVQVLPVDGAIPDVTFPCPSLRGQACRPYQPHTNTARN